jgi:hypothetical protein
MMADGSSPHGRRHLWILVPALAWGGILAGFLLPFSPPLLPFGSLGCVLGSFAIAALAFARKRKDIVSLCTPIFAVIIFVVPLETRPGLLMQVLYAATLTALVIRLEKRFSNMME